MKTKQILLISLFGLSFLFTNAQNVLSTPTMTSGGNNAGSQGSNNAFYGYKSGFQQTSSGTRNSYFGNESGSNASNLASGMNNSYFGNSAGSSQSGSYNSGFGSGTFFNGDYNCALGHGAGSGTTGDNNVTIGLAAGEGGQGSNNVFIGGNCGIDLTGSGNVFIGNGVGGFGSDYSSSDKLFIDNSTTASPLIWGDFVQDQLKFNAKVGVGVGFGNYPTTSGSINVSNYNLFVKGGILTEEVRVSLANTWADYVFKKGYKLPTLQEVEKQIQQKGHLINVPSAKEVKNNGIELGEMAKIQQEKIEELTLYIIEQNKINEKQALQLEKQNQEIEALKIAFKQISKKQ